MGSLTRRATSPFDDLLDFRRDFDGIFSQLLRNSGNAGDTSSPFVVAVPAIEAWVDQDQKKYHLSVALAGVHPEDVQINVQGNVLTVSGERKGTRRERKDSDYVMSEFSYGHFERVITLPDGVDTDKLEAQYNDGVLEITAPLSASALPRRVEIKSLPRARNEGLAESKVAGA